MRKHFLILMLLTLLPLAGWAQTATFGEMTLGLYTYGDATLPVPLVKDSESAILTEGTHYTVVNGAFSDAACETTITPAQMKANGTKYYRKVTGKAGTAYEGQSKTAWFTVEKKELNITINTSFQRTYNTLPDPTIAADDWSSTDFAFGQTKSVLTGTLTYDYAGKGVQAYAAGTYPIEFDGLSSDNYTIKYPAKNFTIAAKDLSSEAITVKAGTAFADQTYKGTTYTAGDFSGLVLKYGNKELTQGTDFDVDLSVIYNFTSYSAETAGTQYGTGTVCVLSKDNSDAIVKVVTNSVEGWTGKKFKVALAAAGTGRAQLYGDGTGNDYTTATGVWVNATATTLVKDYSATAYSYGVTFKGNYAGSKANVGSFKINKAPITVSLKNSIKKTYTSANFKDVDLLADAEFNYSGIVGEDVANAATIKAAFTTASTANQGTSNFVVKTSSDAINVGNSYVLGITGGTVGNTYTNYEIKNYLPGTLEITPIELTIKAKDANKTIGADDPEFELDATQYSAAIINGDVVKGVTFSRTNTSEAAGSYDIIPNTSAAKVYRNFGAANQSDETANYTFKISTTKGKLTIGKSEIYVTINDVDKFYGQADPTEFEYTVIGMVSGEELENVTITREAGEAVGFYSLTATIANPNPAKYSSLTVVPGILTIKKAQLIFTIPTQSVAVGATKAALSKATIDVQGINNSDVAADLYDLDFNENSVDLDTSDPKKTTNNKTYDDGILVTLKTAAKAKYEIKVVTDATTNPVTYGYDDHTTGKLIVGTGTGGAITFSSIDNPAATTYDAIMSKAGEVMNVTINFNGRNRKIDDLQTTPVHTWAKDNWNALVLPFDITVAELSSKLGFANNTTTYNYCIVNTIKKDAPSGKFQFQLATGTIEANTPFMVKTVGDITDTDNTNAVTGEINFGAKLIKAPADNYVAAVFDNGFKLVGQYADFVLDKNSTARDAQGNALYKFLYGDDDSDYNFFGVNSTKSWTIVPFDCYVDLSGDPVAARNVVFEFEEADGSTTAIKSVSVESDKVNANKEGWYTINGVKLQNAPTQKGIYIFNGKKLVVK